MTYFAFFFYFRLLFSLYFSVHSVNSFSHLNFLLCDIFHCIKFFSFMAASILFSLFYFFSLKFWCYVCLLYHIHLFLLLSFLLFSTWNITLQISYAFFSFVLFFTCISLIFCSLIPAFNFLLHHILQHVLYICSCFTVSVLS